MALDFISSFESGEMSRNMDGRSDLEVYKKGCRDLDNFIVLQQGGVERRAGTEFVTNTKDPSKPARIIRFDFSSTTQYIIEIGYDSVAAAGYARVHYDGATIPVTVTGTVPYTESDLRDIQFTRRYDTLVLTSHNHPPQLLRRTTITPSFTVEEISYAYPPLLEENLTATTIKPSAKTGTIDIDASAAIFYNNTIDGSHIGSTWAIEHIRDAADISVNFESVNSSATSTALDVSFLNWELETSFPVSNQPWYGSLIIQRRINSTDDNDFVNYIVIADTNSQSEARNFTYASSEPEAAGTELRLVFVRDGGTLSGSLKVTDTVHKGLVKVASVLGSGKVISSATHSSGTMTVTANSHGLANNDYVLLTGLISSDSSTQPNANFQISNVATNTFEVTLSGSSTITLDSNPMIEASSAATATVVSKLGKSGSDSGAATTRWSEAAFSGYRGYPPASEFFENRLWLTGSINEPAEIFGSVFGEIYNFLTGSLPKSGIKRVIDTPEEPRWLKGKQFLFLGTTDSSVSIKAADSDSLITQSNIVTRVENAYGAAALQAELANDTILYAQRDKLKLRELVYSQSENTFLGNDLNFLSQDINSGKIAELFVQKEPQQIVWCILEDGTATTLSYDRGNNIRGWARVNTDGKIYSADSISGDGEDLVWACVQRDFIGTPWTPNTAYVTGNIVSYEGVLYKSKAGADSGNTFNSGDWDVISKTRYCIEKFHLRKDLDWYVDSGKKLDGGASKSISSSDITTDIVITSNSHGFSNGDFVKLSGTISSQLNETPYRVSDGTTNTFKIKATDNSAYIRYNTPNQIIAEGTGIYAGTWELVDLGIQTWQKVVMGNPVGDVVTYRSYKWVLKDSAEGSEILLTTTDGQNYTWDLLEANTGNQQTLGSSILNPANRVNIPWWEESINWIGIEVYNLSFGAGATVQFVYNEVTGLGHIQGKTVQVLGDDSFIGNKTVDINGKVTLDNYYNKILTGLNYTSLVSPMPIEPSLVGRISQGRVKAISKIFVKFFNTIAGKVGESGRQLSNFSAASTEDSVGKALTLRAGEQRFFVATDFEREKLIEVKQDLPYPMTVLSITSNVDVEGA